METRELTLRDMSELGAAFFESGLFSDLKSVAQAVVKIQAGAELGVPPFAAISGIHVIQGKPALGAGLIAARIKASGKYDYRVLRLDDTGCVIEFLQGGTRIGESSFTEEDARRAGLLSREMWQKYARNMYFARALCNGARWYTPDVFSGAIYAPEELDDNANIIEGTILHDEMPTAAPANADVAADWDELGESATAQPTPPQECASGSARPAKHWSEDENVRRRFHAARNEMLNAAGLVAGWDLIKREALGVEQLTQYPGTEEQALDAISKWIAAQVNSPRQ